MDRVDLPVLVFNMNWYSAVLYETAENILFVIYYQIINNFSYTLSYIVKSNNALWYSILHITIK